MSSQHTSPRRREPLRARPAPVLEGKAQVPTPEPAPAPAPAPANLPATTRGGALSGLLGGRGGGGLLTTASQMASAAAAVSREVAANTAEVTRHVVQQATDRQPASEITTTMFTGFVNGAVRAAEAIEAETGVSLTTGVANSLIQGENGPKPAGGSTVARAVSALGQAAANAGHVGDGLMQFGGTTTAEAREELRRLGRDLLLRSAQLDDPDEHPAFRAILREISPDEARIICFLAQAGPQPIVGLLEVDRMKKATREVARNISLIGQEAGCIRPAFAPTYLDNLDRLGIVWIRDFRTGSQEQYDLLYAQPAINDAEKPNRRFVKHQIVDRGVELSTFGRQLYEMSFTEPTEPPNGDDAA